MFLQFQFGFACSNSSLDVGRTISNGNGATLNHHRPCSGVISGAAEAGSVLFRGHASLPGEQLSKRGSVLIATLGNDLLEGAVGSFEQPLCSGDSPRLLDWL